MTRVNVGIHPEELCDKHLVAEYKEILRIPNNLKNRKTLPPKRFTLGAGHVLWCTDHMAHMEERFLKLRAEMQHRGYYSGMSWHGPAQPDLPVSSEELAEARELLKFRINLRLPKDAKWTKRSKPDWVKT